MLKRTQAKRDLFVHVDGNLMKKVDKFRELDRYSYRDLIEILLNEYVRMREKSGERVFSLTDTPKDK